MKYHDNNVSFSLRAGYSLVSGSYTVTGLSITDGQDPDGKNRVGMVKTFHGDQLTFIVGQKASSQVADWFNNNIPASQTTFDHPAGELSFAFLGTLVLTLTGGALGGRQVTFTFNGVALAQGKSGLSNNWWFGGQHASNIGGNQVIVQGLTSGGHAVQFVFLRGGNDVSTVEVTPTTLVDTANWMVRVPDDVSLDRLMMPGSHDSGMSELHHCNPFVGSGPYTQTQSGSVGQQLVDGARYFDIRVDYDYDQLVTYHRTEAFGCNGQPLKAVLDETVAFLGAHPSETAILKFSHIRDYNGHDPADTKRRINELLSSYSASMYTNSDASVNLAKTTLGSLRGKMILVFDYSEYIDPSTGRFRYKDGSAPQSGANLTVYDEYSDTATYDDMAAGQLKKWSDHAAWGGGYLFLLSWTLTSNKPPLTPSIESLAAEANGNLPGVLSQKITVDGWTKPNIVYIDYVNPTTTQSIILYNFSQ